MADPATRTARRSSKHAVGRALQRLAHLRFALILPRRCV
jgi:hypothetical protein